MQQHNVILHFGAAHDQATIITPTGKQVVDFSQFRSKQEICIQQPGETLADFRQRTGALRRNASQQRHAALELIRDFILESRDMRTF